MNIPRCVIGKFYVCWAESFQAPASDAFLHKIHSFICLFKHLWFSSEFCVASRALCDFESFYKCGRYLDWWRHDMNIECDTIISILISNVEKCQISINILLVPDRFVKLVSTHPYHTLTPVRCLSNWATGRWNPWELHGILSKILPKKLFRFKISLKYGGQLSQSEVLPRSG